MVEPAALKEFAASMNEAVLCKLWFLFSQKIRKNSILLRFTASVHRAIIANHLSVKMGRWVTDLLEEKEV